MHKNLMYSRLPAAKPQRWQCWKSFLLDRGIWTCSLWIAFLGNRSDFGDAFVTSLAAALCLQHCKDDMPPSSTASFYSPCICNLKALRLVKNCLRGAQHRSNTASTFCHKLILAKAAPYNLSKVSLSSRSCVWSLRAPLTMWEDERLLDLVTAQLWVAEQHPQ